MHDLITDPLPDTVPIRGRRVRIATDHRVGFRLDALLRAGGPPDQVLAQVLMMYYPDGDLTAGDVDDAVAQIVQFFTGGDPAHGKHSGKDGPQVLSYDYDAALIYAAFRQAYGIDLIRETLHWWQFLALLQAIPADTTLARIIGYRAGEVPDGASDAERQRIKALAAQHAIPASADHDRAVTDLTDILMRGGNPEDALRRL